MHIWKRRDASVTQTTRQSVTIRTEFAACNNARTTGNENLDGRSGKPMYGHVFPAESIVFMFERKEKLKRSEKKKSMDIHHKSGRLGVKFHIRPRIGSR